MQSFPGWRGSQRASQLLPAHGNPAPKAQGASGAPVTWCAAGPPCPSVGGRCRSELLELSLDSKVGNVPRESLHEEARREMA